MSSSRKDHAPIPKEFKGARLSAAASSSYDLIPSTLSGNGSARESASPANVVLLAPGQYAHVPDSMSGSAPVNARQAHAHYNAVPEYATASGIASNSRAQYEPVAVPLARASSSSLSDTTVALQAAIVVRLDDVPVALRTVFVDALPTSSASLPTAADVKALERLPLHAFLSLLWASFAAHAEATAKRGVYRLIEIARRSPQLTSFLPQLFLDDETPAVAIELARRVRAPEPLAALVGVTASHKSFKRASAAIHTATTLSYAFEGVAGVALRALKTESPELFAGAWLATSTELRARMPLLISAHANEPYDANLKALLSFDAAKAAGGATSSDRRDSNSRAGAPPPRLQRRKSTALQLTQEHTNMIHMLAGYNADQLSSALRDTLLGEAGTRSDDEDDDDVGSSMQPVRRLRARTSVLELVLVDDDDDDDDDADNNVDNVATEDTEPTDVWLIKDVKKDGNVGNDADNYADLFELRRRVAAELTKVSAQDFAAMTSAKVLQNLFALFVAERLRDVPALLVRLRDASALGGARFDALLAAALQAMSAKEFDRFAGALRAPDATWLRSRRRNAPQ